MEPQPPILPYAPPPRVRGNRRAVIVMLILGIPGGLILSFTGYLMVFGGAFVGFVIGAVCARVADTRRLRFGIAGSGMAALTCLLSVVIQFALDGPPTRRLLEQMSLIAGVILVTICLPGWFGGLFILWLQSLTRFAASRPKRPMK